MARPLWTQHHHRCSITGCVLQEPVSLVCFHAGSSAALEWHRASDLLLSLWELIFHSCLFLLGVEESQLVSSALKVESSHSFLGSEPPQNPLTLQKAPKAKGRDGRAQRDSKQEGCRDAHFTARKHSPYSGLGPAALGSWDATKILFQKDLRYSDREGQFRLCMLKATSYFKSFSWSLTYLYR